VRTAPDNGAAAVGCQFFDHWASVEMFADASERCSSTGLFYNFNIFATFHASKPGAESFSAKEKERICKALKAVVGGANCTNLRYCSAAPIDVDGQKKTVKFYAEK
jgi:hypothetical protein